MNEKLIQTFNQYSGKFILSDVKKGALYIVSTPIGNLEDISFRALHVLNNVDIIACEDTRVTNFLLSQYSIKNRTVSYYSHVEKTKIEYLISELEAGKSIALTSDAGTPCISDPGNILVSTCIDKGIEVFSIPGVSALIHAFILSGFSMKTFFFQGFLPLKKGRQSLLKELSTFKMPVIIYESPYRVHKTLKEVLEYFGNKEVSLSRELTKKFEQVIRGKVKSILNQNIKIKGEFVIIINNS